VSLIRLPVDAEGFVDLGELETLLRAYNREGQHGKQRIQLVAVCGRFERPRAYSTTWRRSVESLTAMGRACWWMRRSWSPTGWSRWKDGGIDYLAFSAHKVYAPFGTGVLVVRKGLLQLSPAELERIRSSGEENAGGVAALGVALVLLQRIGLDVIQEEEQALTARALRGMAQIPGLKIYGTKDPDSLRFARKGGVIAFDLGNILPGRVARELAERGGIGVRYGCHCAHLLISVWSVFPTARATAGPDPEALPRLALPGVVRVSLGIENSAEDVDALIHVLGSIAQQPRAAVERGHPPTDGRFRPGREPEGLY